jgi:metal-responsive CopG/Arc/MetJ family transcriptional regulator
MRTVKTAISLPASLFEQAETLAGEMQISQSFLIEIALEEFIRRRENQQLLEKINAACEVPLSEHEQVLLHKMSRSHRRLGEGEG